MWHLPCCVGSRHGVTPDEIIALGHSSGAHLAALVALRGDTLYGECDYPYVPIDRMIGLAGLYDIERASRVAAPLFSGDATSSDWHAANPAAHTTARPDLPFLLIHGTNDRTVPMTFTDTFAAALTAGGHQVTLHHVLDASHHTIYTPEAALEHIINWLDQHP